ncbi:hypothetical protein [Kribbella solani]|uniref:Secreted protein n=2 Tax=Kribbella solani TaxID=236067 RepID=A0A841DDZ5_9ACTN|nr:hypothetical protein [Kribbella solani]MBB5976773.1 hypothetical protein [Kribbella solani]MDX2969564.1 hypothetical protein [Kribbella solani]MDX3005796.1 hypothetical protein [Kribbella solani]
MTMQRVLVRAIAATAVGAAAAGGLSIAAWGATDSAQACAHYVAPPDSNGNNVWVSGSRRGCTGNVRLTIELFKSYWGVDGVVATGTGTGTNFEVTAKGACADLGHQKEVYGKLKDSSGGTWQGVKQKEC